MDEREAYIALNMMEGVGPVNVRSLATALGSTQAIFKASKQELQKVAGIGSKITEKILAQRDQLRVERELKRVEKMGARIITQVDKDYPPALLQIHDPPLALYVLGNLLPEDKRAMAIVGSRRTTLYGRETAERFAFQLARINFVIVSGLARGIDTAAHLGALKGKGRTLAVLGSALNHVYPSENTELAGKISEHGAVISEFPLDKKPDVTTFPIRNRIISGLSMGILVIEAALNSGAMITVNQALEQGRSVFAVPGRIDSPGSRGTHQLIKTGARLAENIDDILEEFEYLIPPADRNAGLQDHAMPQLQLSAAEKQVVEILTEDGELDVDTLTRRTGGRAEQVSVLLLGLEMKRVLHILPGRLVALNTQNLLDRSV